MLNCVNLLPLDDVQGKEKQKLTKNRKIYQLKNIDEETYNLSIFDMLVFRGYFNNYLLENRITLCYVIQDTELELNELFVDSIKRYEVKEDGTLKLQPNMGITKMHKKRDIT